MKIASTGPSPVSAGARQVECTINGIGERAGNASLEEIVMAIKTRNDLMPYKTEINTTYDICNVLVNHSSPLISESGLNTKADLARMANVGARCFLIGEALMRQENLEDATRSILSNPII